MKRLTLVASIDNATGYGLHAIQIVRDIERLTGAHVAIRPIQQKQMFGSNIPTDIRQRFVNGPQPEEWELVLSPPFFRPTPGKKTAYFSMWEATRLPPGGAACLNLAEIVIVPTSWGASCFSASGVDRTLRVVPLGIDDSVYHFRHPNTATEPAKAHVRAVFGTAGRMSHGGIRKGINEVIELFQRAFPTEKDVLLRVKVHPDCPVTRLDDPRIEIKAAHLPDEQLADWFAALTCFVSAAKGEGWGLCLDPSTTVILNGQAKDIKDAKVGDSILGGDATERIIVATSFRTASNRFKIKIGGVNPIIATGEHPFFAVKTATKAKHVDSMRRRLDLKPEWVEAKDLKRGYLIAIPKPDLNVPLPRRLDIFEFLRTEMKMLHSSKEVWMKMGFSPITCQLVKMKRYVRLDAKFLNFIGWYLAEGSPNLGRGLEINLHVREMPIAQQLIRFVRDAFGLRGTVAKKPTTKCLRVHFSSMILSRLMTTLCGTGAKRKILHPLLYKSGAFLGPLLKGFVMGDGHYDKGSGWEVVTASRDLIWQVKHILNSAGINASMYNHMAGFRLDMKGDAGLKFCKWSHISKRQKLRRAPMRMCVERDGYFFAPIKKIEPLETPDTVVNLEVDGDHTFLANGVVVHNCQQQAMATGRPVVAARFAGLADFLTPDNGFCVPFVLGATEQAYAGCGHWAWPSDDGFIEAMRAIHREPHSAAQKGAQASQDVAHLTWDNSNRKLVEVLREVGAL